MDNKEYENLRNGMDFNTLLAIANNEKLVSRLDPDVQSDLFEYISQYIRYSMYKLQSDFDPEEEMNKYARELLNKMN